MTRLVISSRDAERIAKSFDDMLSAKGLNAVRRRAVNEIGSGLRKKTRAVAPGLYGTTAAALMIQGQSASAGLRRSRIPAPHGDVGSGATAPRQLAKGEAPGRPTPAHPRHPGARPAGYLQLGEARGARVLPATRRAAYRARRRRHPHARPNRPLPMRAPADMPSWRGSASAPPATCPRRSRGKSERCSPSGDDGRAVRQRAPVVSDSGLPRKQGPRTLSRILDALRGSGDILATCSKSACR